MALNPTSVGDNVQTPSIQAEIYVPDQLIAGRFPLVTQPVTIAAGAAVLKRGTVLGIVTASGKYIQSVKTAADGSQNPVAILADDADPTGGDVQAGVYLTGEFNQNAIIFDASWTVATLTAPLRALSIFLKPSVSAADPT